MSKRREIEEDIERRIAERDRLLARAQRTSEAAFNDGRIELTMLAERERLAARVQLLEDALLQLADREWLTRASIEDVVTIARAALEGEQIHPIEHWLSRVDRIVAIAGS